MEKCNFMRGLQLEGRNIVPACLLRGKNTPNAESPRLAVLES